MKRDQKRKAILIRLGLCAAAVIMVVLLIAGLSDTILRPKVDVDGFEKVFSSVSSATRSALRSELERVTKVNSGEKNFNAKYKLRDDNSAKIVDNDKEHYGTAYLDSEPLQISLFVQMNWAGGLSKTSEPVAVRIECADREHWAYETNNCYVPEMGEVFTDFELDNFSILNNYDVDSLTIEKAREASLTYLKTIEAGAKEALIVTKTISQRDDQLSAEICVDFKDCYRVAITKSDSPKTTIYKGESVLLEQELNEMASPTRHYSAIARYLPIELSTEQGTDYALRWSGENKLKISSDYCKASDNDAALIEDAKEWLKSMDFKPEDFEISTLKSCIK